MKLINCLNCKSQNLKFQKSCGSSKNILQYKENICLYKCLDCETNNLYSTNILNKDYSDNISIWKELKYTLLEDKLMYEKYDRDLEKYRNKVWFNKVKKENNRFYFLGQMNYPDEEGLYIITPKKDNEKFIQLNIIYYQKSLIVLK